jgi:acetyltransferase-like isoleucine patch superfamily enzyme
VTEPPDPYVHETAIVEPGASVGSGTRVWHHAHVRTGACVGSGCTLGKNVFVDSGASIGDRVKIQNNVSVFTGVTLDDEVFVGPSAVFTNDLRPRATSSSWQVVPTRVHRGASIGANATIICGIDVGSFAMVAAGSVVTRSVPDHALVRGNPARVSGWVCRCGELATSDTTRPSDLACGGCDWDGTGAAVTPDGSTGPWQEGGG